MCVVIGRSVQLTWVVMAVALVATGANPAVAQRDFSKVEITTTDLGDGLAMLQGAGGNLGVSSGPDGVFLIDDQFAPMTEKIRAAIRALSKEPIRFLFNTHWHGDHTGGNENLGKAGVLIFAHDHVRERMRRKHFYEATDRRIPASPEVAWPVVTFDHGLTLHLNGQTIEAIYVAPAHTDGDSFVFFHEADVLHMGDTFFSGKYPFIDLESGGEIGGMIAAVEQGLSIAGSKTRIIPGHGPLSSRADLKAMHGMLIAIRDRIRKLIDEGKSREDVIASKPTREFDAEYDGGFVGADRFAGIVYDSLTRD